MRICVKQCQFSTRLSHNRTDGKFILIGHPVTVGEWHFVALIGATNLWKKGTDAASRPASCMAVSPGPELSDTIIQSGRYLTMLNGILHRSKEPLLLHSLCWRWYLDELTGVIDEDAVGVALVVASDRATMNVLARAVLVEGGLADPDRMRVLAVYSNETASHYGVSLQVALRAVSTRLSRQVWWQNVRLLGTCRQATYTRTALVSFMSIQITDKLRTRCDRNPPLQSISSGRHEFRGGDQDTRECERQPLPATSPPASG